MLFYYPKKDENEYQETSETVDLFDELGGVDYVPSIIEYACQAMKLVIMNRYRERTAKDGVRPFFEEIDKFENIIFEVRTRTLNNETNHDLESSLSNQSRKLTRMFLNLMEK